MKKIIGILLAYLICLGVAFLLVFNAEHINKTQKKELPVATQNNSLEK